MKTVKELNERKAPIVTIDPSLERYKNAGLFPKKLAMANDKLKTAKLQERKKRR